MKFLISTLFFLLISSIFAFPQPFPSIKSSLPANVSRGSRPSPPAGFRTKITYINTRILNPIHVYLLAVHYFYWKAEYGWDVPVPSEGPTHRRELDASIYVHLPSKPGSYVLATGHVLLGLYDGVVAMSRDRFQSMSIEIFMFEQSIGKIYITHRFTDNSPLQNRMLPIRREDSMKELGTRTNPSNVSNPEDSGRYVDPFIKNCAVVYDFNPGKIRSADIFTIIMEGIMIVAYDGTHDSFDYLNAASASGNCAMNIHKPPGLQDRISGLKATTLLYMLTGMIVQQRRFGDLDFSFEFGEPEKSQKTILEGFIMGLGPPRDRSSGDVVVTE